MDTIMYYCKRIVGGEQVGKDSYTFMATLWYLDGNEFLFKCGASYIGGKFFLTAAHCMRGREPRKTVVRMGSNKLRGLPETMRVSKVHIHPDFNSVNLRNDIAIIEVDKAPSKKYLPVRLPCNHLINMLYTVGSGVKVLGFGKESESSTKEHLEDLKEVDLRIRSIIETRYHRGMIGPDVFLAGSMEGGVVKDSCTGDSGGPCVKMVKGSWVLVGIVSWGSGCGKAQLPGVYTKVLSYHQWIRKKCGFGVCSNH